jgi:cytochrome c biogenesis protein CcdA
VIVLLGVGFLAGVVTAISPCVLPVLPIILAGSSVGGRRRPFAIIAGLVLSFTLFLLIGTWLLDLLGLPQDFLRNVATGLLFLLAAMLILPRLARAALHAWPIRLCIHLRLRRRHSSCACDHGSSLGISARW